MSRDAGQSMWMVGRRIWEAAIFVQPVARSVRMARAPRATPKMVGLRKRCFAEISPPQVGGKPVRLARKAPRNPAAVKTAMAVQAKTAACEVERKAEGKKVSTSLTKTR